MKKSKQKKGKVPPGFIWVAFPGFMFLGLGIGMFFGQTGAGVLVGMGLGFLAVVLLGIKYRSELEE